MTPEDFPIERLRELERDLIQEAEKQLDRARFATGEGVQSEHHGVLRQTAHGSPVGYYESALSYLEAARLARQTNDDIFRRLVALAAQRQQPETHPWPIAHLEWLTDAHRELDEWGMPEEFRGRFPRWGVTSDHNADTINVLTISPASASVGGLLVRATQGDQAMDDATPDQVIYMNVSWEQWDALVAHVARIRAGQLIPYDDDGNIRGPQPHTGGDQ